MLSLDIVDYFPTETVKMPNRLRYRMRTIECDDLGQLQLLRPLHDHEQRQARCLRGGLHHQVP